MGTKITAIQEWFLKRLKNNIDVLQYKWKWFILSIFNPLIMN